MELARYPNADLEGPPLLALHEEFLGPLGEHQIGAAAGPDHMVARGRKPSPTGISNSRQRIAASEAWRRFHAARDCSPAPNQVGEFR